MYRGGIGGIERKIKDRQEITDKNISNAFQDLQKLMEMAKDMVQLSRNITQKLRDKGNDISTDETVLLKSHLLSLGVAEQSDDPVMRQNFASDSKYYKELSKQIANIIKPIADKSGGQMSLTDVFCTVNRARGFELISPEDLLNSCLTLNSQNIGVKLVKYKSGLMVIQCDSYNEDAMCNQVIDYFENQDSITAHELAITANISIALARQRLIDCENAGLVCRDESIQGLKFFPNKFLSENSD